MSGWSQMASTDSRPPWTTLKTLVGDPLRPAARDAHRAQRHELGRLEDHELRGRSRWESTSAAHMLGNLNGVIAATMPTGNRSTRIRCRG